MATLSFCASLTTTLQHNQTPTLSSYSSSSSSSSKTNLRFLSLTHTLSSHSLISSFSSSPRASKLSFVPKFSETEPSILEAPILEAPILEAEPQPESEPSQVVEATTEEPSQVVEATTEEPKREEVFAVVMIGSRQYIVFPGRFIYTQRFKGANVNDKVILNKVLLVGTKTSTYIGQPVVPNAAVHAVVEEQGLNKKVTVFKYKKKKGYRRNIGHRQPNTRIRIMGITGYENSPAVTLP